MTGEEIRAAIDSDDKCLLLPSPRFGSFNISPIGGHRTLACIPLTSTEYLTDKVAKKSWHGDRIKLAKALIKRHGYLPLIMYLHILVPIKRGAWAWKSVYQRRRSPRTR